MITRLNGIIIHKQPPFLTIDVGGVGYEIQAPMSTFYHLPEINQTVILLTHLNRARGCSSFIWFLSWA